MRDVWIVLAPSGFRWNSPPGISSVHSTKERAEAAAEESRALMPGNERFQRAIHVECWGVDVYFHARLLSPAERAVAEAEFQRQGGR